PPTSGASSAPECIEADLVCLIRRLNVVAKQVVVVPQVQAAVGDHRIGPGCLPAAVRLVESTFLYVTLRVGFHQSDRTAFRAGIEIAVRESDRTFADTAVGPLHGSSLEFNAGEVCLIKAVEVAVHDHHAAVVVAHIAGEVDLRGADSAAGRSG